MNADRELLELAAKAAGYEGTEWANGTLSVLSGHNLIYWNPLADYGDALRLACKFKLKVFFGTDLDDECKSINFVFAQHGDIGCGWPKTSIHEHIEDIDDLDEVCEATCRAIVRAVVEIAKAMP